MHYLFSYGTLQLEQVQLENYGRKLVGHKDILKGYKIENLKIKDKEVIRISSKNIHPVAIRTDNPLDYIEGVVFEITDDELTQTDKYEVSDYERVKATFASGKEAWVYIAKNKH